MIYYSDAFLHTVLKPPVNPTGSISATLQSSACRNLIRLVNNEKGNTSSTKLVLAICTILKSCAAASSRRSLQVKNCTWSRLSACDCTVVPLKPRDLFTLLMKDQSFGLFRDLNMGLVTHTSRGPFPLGTVTISKPGWCRCSNTSLHITASYCWPCAVSASALTASKRTLGSLFFERATSMVFWLISIPSTS